MSAIIVTLFFFVSSVQTQNYYPYNNYNSWQSNYPTWNSGFQQQNRLAVRGNLLSDDQSGLPYGAQISVSLVDVALQDVSARPLNSVVLYGSYRFPIAYEIPYTLGQIQNTGNSIQQFAIQARIEKDGQLFFINDQYTPVRLVPAQINPVNVMMKRVSNTNNQGFLSTRPPGVTNDFSCQLRPDPGMCYGYFEQFYYNAQFRSCQVFTWGGCGGNQNRFNSLDECERTCSPYRRRMFHNNAKRKWMD